MMKESNPLKEDEIRSLLLLTIRWSNKTLKFCDGNLSFLRRVREDFNHPNADMSIAHDTQSFTFDKSLLFPTVMSRGE